MYESDVITMMMFKKLITGDVTHEALLEFLPFGMGYLNTEEDDAKPCIHSLSLAMMLQNACTQLYPHKTIVEWMH